MDESQIADVWLMFKEYLDKKHLAMAAERFVDLMADYGVDDEDFKSLLGTDATLDKAIYYYLELDEPEEDWDE